MGQAKNRGTFEERKALALRLKDMKQRQMHYEMSRRTGRAPSKLALVMGLALASSQPLEVLPELIVHGTQKRRS